MSLITIDNIGTTIFQYLDGLGIAPLLFINKTVVHEKPFIVLELVRSPSRNIGLTNGGKVHAGQPVFKVITELNTHDTLANTIAQQIVEAFPFGLTLECGEGKLRFDKETHAEMGYPTDTSFCTPVIAHYVATGR